MAREKSPAFQFYPSDFLADAKQVSMSTSAVGCYWRLICHCWIEGSLPDDDHVLRMLSAYRGRLWNTIWPQLVVCFERRDGRLIHPRLERDRLKQAENRAKRQRAGRKGGLEKASKRLALLQQSPSKPIVKSSSSSSSSSNNPPTPLSAKGGRRYLRADLKQAQRIRKLNFGRCPHDPSCAGGAECEGRLAQALADRRATAADGRR